MRIKSGDTTKYVYFVGFADTGTNPGTNRMTGYSAKFTVRRSRDGGASAAYTTPTINETDSTNMPGVYELLLDEDTTMAAGHFEEAYVVHIDDTGGHVRPITREISLYQADTGDIADAIWAKATRTLTTAHDTGVLGAITALSTKVDTGVPASIDQTDTGIRQYMDRVDTGLRDYMDNVDTGVHDVISKLSGKVDTGLPLSVWTSATRSLTSFAFDTGVADTVWKSSSSSFTGDTGSVGYAQGRLMAVKGDTGAAHLDGGRLGVSATATLDTGAVNQAVWQADAERTISNLSAAQATQLATMVNENDTGRLDVAATATLDTGAVNQAVWQADGVRGLTTFPFDTGIAQTVWREPGSTYTDTGSVGYMQDNQSGGVDTGQVNQAVWQADASRTLTAWAFDTGVQQKLDRMDTGLRGLIDTGVKDDIAELSSKMDTGVPASIDVTDTGLRQYIDRTDTGLRGAIDNVDTGITQRLGVLDTGLRNVGVEVSSISDTGLTNRFDTIDTNVAAAKTAIDVIDTGVRNATQDANIIAVIGDTGVAGHVAHAFVDTGAPKANITQVNDVTVSGTGDTGTGNAWGPA